MYERMLNKSVIPTEDEIYAQCGENGALFKELDRFMLEEIRASKEIRFPYGNSYGWCLTYRKKKKLLCDAFAESGAFCVMLRLTNQAYNELYPQVSEYTRGFIDKKYPCNDGGWIHYRVLEKSNLEDIKMLLAKK